MKTKKPKGLEVFRYRVPAEGMKPGQGPYEYDAVRALTPGLLVQKAPGFWVHGDNRNEEAPDAWVFSIVHEHSGWKVRTDDDWDTFEDALAVADAFLGIKAVDWQVKSGRDIMGQVAALHLSDAQAFCRLIGAASATEAGANRLRTRAKNNYEKWETYRAEQLKKAEAENAALCQKQITT